jgi:starch synthase
MGGRTNRKRVVLASAWANHSYQTALALHEAGMLEKFVTGMYRHPGRLSGRALGMAIRAVGSERDVLRYRNRRQVGLPAETVASVGVGAQMVEHASRRVAGAVRFPVSTTIAYFRNEWFDLLAARHVRDCEVFHGFEGCAKFGLRRAREKGLVTVLDQPIIHRSLYESIEADVCDELGVPLPRRAPGYKMHVARKYAELELVDYVFVGLNFVKESFRKAGFPAERIFVVPYGADTTRFRVTDRSSRSGPLRILFVGQISWLKGLHFLLDVFAELPIDARLTVIGNLHDGWEAYFEERISSTDGSVKCLVAVPHLAIDEHLEAADIFVFPSLVGGIGLAVYEAMASGLPVVTSDGDVVIRDGKDGLVAPAGAKEAWIEALVKLAEDSALRMRLGASAAERVREFSWESYRQRVRDAYDRISGGAP